MSANPQFILGSKTTDNNHSMLGAYIQGAFLPQLAELIVGPVRSCLSVC